MVVHLCFDRNLFHNFYHALLRWQVVSDKQSFSQEPITKISLSLHHLQPTTSVNYESSCIPRNFLMVAGQTGNNIIEQVETNAIYNTSPIVELIL